MADEAECGRGGDSGGGGGVDGDGGILPVKSRPPLGLLSGLS